MRYMPLASSAALPHAAGSFNSLKQVAAPAKVTPVARPARRRRRQGRGGSLHRGPGAQGGGGSERQRHASASARAIVRRGLQRDAVLLRRDAELEGGQVAGQPRGARGEAQHEAAPALQGGAVACGQGGVRFAMGRCHKGERAFAAGRPGVTRDGSQCDGE